MELEPYVDSLRRELVVAAEVGGDDVRAVAERLLAPLDSSVRLTLLKALSAAAEEINRDLAPGSVELRLHGLDPSFAVTPASTQVSEPDLPEPPMAPSMPEDGATARINFRPPEQLKARIEEVAGREGLSVNAWLVRSVTATLNREARRPVPRSPVGGDHQSGWAR